MHLYVLFESRRSSPLVFKTQPLTQPSVLDHHALWFLDDSSSFSLWMTLVWRREGLSASMMKPPPPTVPTSCCWTLGPLGGAVEDVGFSWCYTGAIIQSQERFFFFLPPQFSLYLESVVTVRQRTNSSALTLYSFYRVRRCFPCCCLTPAPELPPPRLLSPRNASI